MIRYEKRKIADLMLDEHNPRTISKAAKGALAASVRRFGLVQPIVINETTGRVIGGHQRIAVLKEQGVEDVDVAIGSWTASDERALNVALNNPAGQGEFTDVKSYLANALQTLSLSDFSELRFDELTLGASKANKERKEARALEYKLVVTCDDEEHQAALLEDLEARGLNVKLLIV